MLFGEIALQPVHKSFVWAMLSGLSVVAAIGLFAPLRMLPILLFEIAWKVIWFLTVALPRHLSGRLEEPFVENLFAVGLVLPFILIFPWHYYFSTIRANLDQWRGARTPTAENSNS